VFCKNHPDVVEGLVRCAGCDQDFCPDCLVELKGKRLCAGCKSEAVKDIQSGVPVGSELRLAGVGVRFLAILLDGLVVFIPFTVISVVIVFAMQDASPSTGAPVIGPLFQLGLQLSAVGVMIVYEALMLGARGQTVGKIALGIKVVTAEGNDISMGQAWVRPIVRALLGMIPFLIGVIVNYVPAFASHRMCIHDRAAKTRVIKIR
jgi:uncharacterized RDD family membrane protein YckC